MDLDRLVQHAFARIALNIEKVAGPSDPGDPLAVQAHQKQLAILDTDLTRTKSRLQNEADNDGFGGEPSADSIETNGAEPKQLVLF